MVDAELAALAVDALLGRARLAVDLLGVARVGVHQHELADVVEERGAEQLVAIRVVGCAASRSAARWVATACRRKRSGAASQPGVRSKKSKVSASAASASTPSGVSTSTAGMLGAILPLLAPSSDVRDPQHGDHERHVRLHGGDNLAHRGAVLGDAQHAVARLGERRKRLERLEGGRQAPAVSLVVGRQTTLAGVTGCVRRPR